MRSRINSFAKNNWKLINQFEVASSSLMIKRLKKLRVVRNQPELERSTVTKQVVIIDNYVRWLRYLCRHISASCTEGEIMSQY